MKNGITMGQTLLIQFYLSLLNADSTPHAVHGKADKKHYFEMKSTMINPAWVKTEEAKLPTNTAKRIVLMLAKVRFYFDDASILPFFMIIIS